MKRIVLVALVALVGLAAPAVAQTPAAGVDGDRFFLRGEYLLWWMKDSPAPVPLVTNGVLDDPSTRVFLGGQDIDVGHRNGARLTLGYWLTADRSWGVEASGFYLPTVTERRGVSSSGEPGSATLNVPFVGAFTGLERVATLADPGFFSGSATEELTSRLWGVEGNVVFALSNRGPWRVEWLGGIRHLNLTEKYSFETSSPDLPPGSTTVFATRDVFDASNQFYGGQLGLRARYRATRWTADATLTAAVGVMRQSVDVSGAFQTNFFTPPTVLSFAGGYFAQPTNMGSHKRDVVAVVPELGLNVGYRLTDWASIVVGYTFLYASNVARPGNQLDRTINFTQAPAIALTTPPQLDGPARPAFKFQGSDFWAHGLNVGVALNF